MRHRPVVVLEDLHWASAELIGLLPRLLEANGPVLIVGTARPADDGWAEGVAGHPAVSRLRLEPLGNADSETLLVELVGERGIRPELRAAALERADGNPFFLEEIVRHVLEGGVAAATEIPHSVHALLASRIDLLPSLEKRALREASVLGRFFRADALANAMGTEVQMCSTRSTGTVSCRAATRPAHRERPGGPATRLGSRRSAARRHRGWTPDEARPDR